MTECICDYYNGPTKIANYGGIRSAKREIYHNRKGTIIANKNLNPNPHANDMRLSYYSRLSYPIGM